MGYVNIPATSGLIGSISDTNSIDLSETGGQLTADLRLSADAVTAGWLLVTLTEESDGLKAEYELADTPSISLADDGSGALEATLELSAEAATAGFALVTLSEETDGLKAEAPIADTDTTGFISDTDWDTFNNAATHISAITDGSSPGAGTVGESSSQTQALTTTGIGATTAYGSALSITLGAGVWQIEGLVLVNDNGAPISDTIQAGIGTSAAGAGLSDLNTIQMSGVGSASNDRAATLLPLLVSISASTTYYLNTKFTYSSGTPQHGGRLQARRIR